MSTDRARIEFMRAVDNCDALETSSTPKRLQTAESDEISPLTYSVEVSASTGSIVAEIS